MANAINEEADCVMLSGETTTGLYPLECVRMLKRISSRIEKELPPVLSESIRLFRPKAKMLRSAALLALRMGNTRFWCLPEVETWLQNWGPTAQWCPLFAFTDIPGLHRRLRLIWGIDPFLMDFSNDPEVTIQDALKRLKSENRVEIGDQIVMVTNVLADGKVVESIQLREVD